MPDISAFRGTLYDPTRVSLSEVMAPPYDVIDESGREKLLAKHPSNCVRLILPSGQPEGKYEHAKNLLGDWVREGTLRRDMMPALYRYHQSFSLKGLPSTSIVRRGFIAAVRLHDFSENVILPHERTLKGPKIDRLNLMRATRSHFSQIFTMYADPNGSIDAVFAPVTDKPAPIAGTSDDGTLHELWRLDDPTSIKKIQELMADKPLYIADGHHRYETMLALRRELDPSGKNKELGFGTMFLSNMDDPGLVVLPTHRLVHSLPNLDKKEFVGKVEKFFRVSDVESPVQVNNLLEELKKSGEQETSLAMTFSGSDKVQLLSLRSDVNLKSVGLDPDSPVSKLDVTLLHQIILETVLGIDKEAQEKQTNLSYIKDTHSALERARHGEGQICFLMNATPLQQVKDVSDAGEVMPQKSTFFYPKIASGIVLRELDLPLAAEG